MYQKIMGLSDRLTDQLVKDRRDFHKYAETGWLEIRDNLSGTVKLIFQPKIFAPLSIIC